MYRHVCCLSEARRRARVLVRATDAQLACDRVIHYTQRSFGRSRVLRSGLAPTPRTRYVTRSRESSTIQRLSETPTNGHRCARRVTATSGRHRDETRASLPWYGTNLTTTNRERDNDKTTHPYRVSVACLVYGSVSVVRSRISRDPASLRRVRGPRSDAAQRSPMYRVHTCLYEYN